MENDYKEEAMRYRFETVGRLYIDGFQVKVLPPWSDYDPDEIIEFEATSVGVVVITQYNEEYYHLLVQQADREGNPWEIPSGKVDKELDQCLMDTMVRELFEETGFVIDAETIKLLPLTYRRKPDSNKGGLQVAIELPIDPDTFEVVLTDEQHIYLVPPSSVDRSEIAMLCLEKLTTEPSLLETSAHPWAYSNYFNLLAAKGFPV